MSELDDLRARRAALDAGRRNRRAAHRLALAEVAYVPPTPAEMEQAHREIHGAPRDNCPRCWHRHQLTLFEESP